MASAPLWGGREQAALAAGMAGTAPGQPQPLRGEVKAAVDQALAKAMDKAKVWLATARICPVNVWSCVHLTCCLVMLHLRWHCISTVQHSHVNVRCRCCRQAPVMLRLVFHDAATYDAAAGDGGADASVQFELDRAENFGLKRGWRVIETAQKVLFY